MILNIHGFLSAGENSKKVFLEKAYPGEEVLSPDLPLDPDEAFSLLRQLVGENGDSIRLVVGSSLGGFYAMLLTSLHDAPTVLLNPAVAAFLTLGGAVGLVENLKNGQKGTWTHAHCHELLEIFCRYAPAMCRSNLHLFTCDDDDRLDHSLTRSFLHDAATLKSLPWGGHRFQGLERLVPDLEKICPVGAKRG